MKYIMKAFAAVSLFSLVILQSTVNSGTVDSATLYPSSLALTLTPHTDYGIDFSFTNDQSYTLQKYHAEFSYTQGLNILSQIDSFPSAQIASIDTRKRLITLEWSNIWPGQRVFSSIYVNGGTPLGTYFISPSNIYYIDNNRKTHNVTCNTVQITMEKDQVAPPPPKAVTIESSPGSLILYLHGGSGADDLVGYNIYRRTPSTSYIKLNSSGLYTGTQYFDNTVQDGTGYYYALTAVDASGNESSYSIEAGETYYYLPYRSISAANASVAIGDVNGDGKLDIVVGNPAYSTGNGGNVQYSIGKVEVYFGGNTTGVPDFTIIGEVAKGQFGYSLAVVDLNNDGYDDIVVGAPYYTAPNAPLGYGETGKIYVYAGGPQLNSTPVYTKIGDVAYASDGGIYWTAEHFGNSIAPAGDVNGDGYRDVVIGAPYGGRDRGGRILVLYGGNNVAGHGEESFSCYTPWQLMGSSVSSAGDVNKDGYGDIIIGAPGDGSQNLYGEAFLFTGGVYPRQSYIFSTGVQNDGFGRIVSSAGDLNADGYADIAIVGKSSDPIRVYLGGPTLTNEPGMLLYQSTTGLVAVEDINQDGHRDLLADGPTFYYSNEQADNIADFPRSDGRTIVGIGDTNGDGTLEIIERDTAHIYISLTPYLELPDIELFYPHDHTYTKNQRITLQGRVRGNVSGVRMLGQVVPLQADGTFVADVALALGDNVFEILAETPNGKIGKRKVTVTYALPDPLILMIGSPADGTTVNTTPITVTGNVSDETAHVAVNGIQSSLTGTTFSASGINLTEGPNTITANAGDIYGQTASISVTVTLITKGNITGTITDSTTGLPAAAVAVTIKDSTNNTFNTTTGSDGTYSISGVTQGSFLATFTKTGYIEQNISSSLTAGTTKTLNVQLVPKPPLTVSITAPLNGAVLNTSTVTVTGNVTNTASVTINGVQATVSSNTFSAPISLSEGQNTITAVASDQYGQAVSQSIAVTVVLPKPPVITNIEVTSVTADSATITWTTDQLSDGVVEYGQTATYGSIATNPTMTTTHSVALAGLSLNTTYHFKVTSRNAEGLALSSADYTFTTSPFKSNSLGEIGNVTVMEVLGNYDARNLDGSINSLPRQEIAKEFYRTHPDDYDTLVIITNFDFAMAESEAKAFYTEIKNDVQGIGRPLTDSTAFYGSSGRLHGTIDMGNITALGINPLDPGKFDSILDILAHEQMHRWGAYVRFKNPDGTLSAALLGKDSRHWSYLLDSDGSVMYGNDWKSNGDGTFTSVSAPKYYSALDLYLMGMIDKAQVPPMTLIENGSIDPMLLPSLGTTITGTVRTVSIDDIIVAEGERVPNASTSQKAFKIGFIFITRPGTFTGNEPAGIETIRSAWAGRFASLTGGKGSIADVAFSLTVTITSPSNGAAISRPDVTVKGVIASSTGNETGVTVNGIVAIVSGNQFIAEHVPLAEGANTITVITTDTIGSMATNTVTVNAVSAENYIQVTSNIESGIAPLEAALRVDGSFSITNASINATGPTVPEITVIAPGEYKVKMIAEGIYTFTVSSTGPDGNTYYDTVTVTVVNKNQIDSLLKAKWGGMKTALVGGNAEGAVSYFAERSKESFRQQFNALSQLLPQVAADMGVVTVVNVKDNVSEYDLRTVRNGTTYSFQLLFEKDINGIWRIRSF